MWAYLACLFIGALVQYCVDHRKELAKGFKKYIRVDKLKTRRLDLHLDGSRPEPKQISRQIWPAAHAGGRPRAEDAIEIYIRAKQSEGLSFNDAFACAIQEGYFPKEVDSIYLAQEKDRVRANLRRHDKTPEH